MSMTFDLGPDDARFIASLAEVQREVLSQSSGDSSSLEVTGVGNARHAVTAPVTATDGSPATGVPPVFGVPGSSGVGPIFPDYGDAPP